MKKVKKEELVRQLLEQAAVDVIALLEQRGVICDPQLFEVIQDVAMRWGYELRAEQMGIRGTKMYFDDQRAQRPSREGAEGA